MGSFPRFPGIRFIINVMKRDLKKQFPNVDEASITKVLGNLIYYRYMNPAIVYVFCLAFWLLFFKSSVPPLVPPKPLTLSRLSFRPRSARTLQR